MEEARSAALAAEAPGSFKIRPHRKSWERRSRHAHDSRVPRFFGFPTSLAFLEAIAVVAGLDDFASVREPIE
jgi:hypothetical protein